MHEVITCLEMTAPTQLVPGRPAPAPLEMEEVDSAAALLVRSIYVRIWEGLASGGRMAWSDAQWEDELSRPGVRSWVARVHGDVVGFVELEAEPDGDVGIVVFGLVAEFVGKGFGGAFLTRATETAWKLMSKSGGLTKRVWVQTSSGDHPCASELRGSRLSGLSRRAGGSGRLSAAIGPVADCNGTTARRPRESR
jgi:RimJ/RimL family protein N-acetyltransferase